MLIKYNGVSSLNDTFDHYVSYHKNTYNKVSYETNNGIITYYADHDHIFDGENLFIYYIESKIQKQGTLKSLLGHITNNKFIVSVTIMAIQNPYLDSFLERTEHLGGKWLIQGADRIWYRPKI
jgi:nitrate reductase alpha subunit